MKEWLNQIADCRMFYSEISLFLKGWVEEQAVCWLRTRSEFRGLWGGKKLNQNRVNKHFVLIDGVGKPHSQSFMRQRVRIERFVFGLVICIQASYICES